MDTDELRRRVEALRPNFHSPFDFGEGVHTKPSYVFRRFRRRLRLMQIPEDLSGMTVLDIGAWDGFFSFEFERRRAKRVLAIDTWGATAKRSNVFCWRGNTSRATSNTSASMPAISALNR